MFSFLKKFCSVFHGASASGSSVAEPSFNPATGLLMISSTGVDVAGNPYGIDLSDGRSGSDCDFFTGNDSDTSFDHSSEIGGASDHWTATGTFDSFSNSSNDSGWSSS